jgi:hypothetical protein
VSGYLWVERRCPFPCNHQARRLQWPQSPMPSLADLDLTTYRVLLGAGLPLLLHEFCSSPPRPVVLCPGLSGVESHKGSFKVRTHFVKGHLPHTLPLVLAPTSTSLSLPSLLGGAEAAGAVLGGRAFPSDSCPGFCSCQDVEVIPSTLLSHL